jgi:uncharacterized protein (TIGR02449 family)
MATTTLDGLEAQINELLLAYQHLQLENTALRKKESSLSDECQQLLHKNQTAAKKVQQLLDRLQTLEKV